MAEGSDLESARRGLVMLVLSLRSRLPLARLQDLMAAGVRDADS
jgi:hypothetical protein